ncbi:MAG: GxxExxY protein [Gemmataceae bacterium]
MGKSVDEIERIARILVDSAIAVHRELGPGLLESTYQNCLKYELATRNIPSETEVILPVRFKGLTIEAGYRIDMLVDGCILVENKSVQKLLPIHEAQLLTYLKLSKNRLGFLLNWNVALLKDGIKRFVNTL